MSNQPSPFVSTVLTWIGLFMHRSMRSLVRYARKHGLSLAQITALFQISNRGQLTISEFGDDLGVTSAAASQMLDRLVQQGLVLRSENPQDRREKQLVLSDLGCQVLRDSARTRQAWLERLAATLTPEEQEKVTEGLEILIDRIKLLPAEV